MKMSDEVPNCLVDVENWFIWSQEDAIRTGIYPNVVAQQKEKKGKLPIVVVVLRKKEGTGHASLSSPAVDVLKKACDDKCISNGYIALADNVDRDRILLYCTINQMIQSIGDELPNRGACAEYPEYFWVDSNLDLVPCFGHRPNSNKPAF